MCSLELLTGVGPVPFVKVRILINTEPAVIKNIVITKKKRKYIDLTYQNIYVISCAKKVHGCTQEMYPINIVKDSEFIFHILLITMNSNGGLKSHLRGYGRRNETKTILKSFES